MLAIGTMAPDFTLNDQDGNEIRLSDFRGQTVILYFYSRDNTAGCTRQAQAFAREADALKKENAVILGVSRDSQKSHEGFAQKHSLPFRILSDPETTVLQAYGVWQEKKLYGKTHMGVVRTTYRIDPDGRIASAHEKVKPDENAGDMLRELRGK